MGRERGREGKRDGLGNRVSEGESGSKGGGVQTRPTGVGTWESSPKICQGAAGTSSEEVRTEVRVRLVVLPILQWARLQQAGARGPPGVAMALERSPHHSYGRTVPALQVCRNLRGAKRTI